MQARASYNQRAQPRATRRYAQMAPMWHQDGTETPRGVAPIKRTEPLIVRVASGVAASGVAWN